MPGRARTKKTQGELELQEKEANGGRTIENMEDFAVKNLNLPLSRKCGGRKIGRMELQWRGAVELKVSGHYEFKGEGWDRRGENITGL